MTLSLFKYSGNKGRLLKHYRPPPQGCTRIVEPYLGSGAYSLNFSKQALGFDTDPRVVDLWHFLQEVDPDDLHKLACIFKMWSEDSEGPLDIRDIPLPRGAMLYLKVNVCSLVVGQWSSWRVYPQHNLPLEATLAALQAARRVEVRLGDGSEYEPQVGDMLFVDPPYQGTSGNYHREGEYKPEDTLALVARAQVPVIFTYGTDAPEVFPGLPWEVVRRRQVPNMRSGGTVERTEHVAYLNWPEDEVPQDVLSFFSA